MEVELSRRHMLLAAGATALVPVFGMAQSAPTVVPRPNPKTFKNGDLVWPKKPGAYVPYASEPAADYNVDKKNWLTQRDIYIGQLEQKTNLEVEEKIQIAKLKSMDFGEFLSAYEADEQIGVPSLYAGGGLYVGHVGFIEIDNSGVPFVVEAVFKKGVIRQTYSDWLAGRPGTYIWHGRVIEIDEAQAGLIVSEAKKYLGRPYDFWNFDLDSDAGFYCSKLIWLAVHRALGIAVDGRMKARRWFWFSPKQLLYLKKVKILHDPGKYGTV